MGECVNVIGGETQCTVALNNLNRTSLSEECTSTTVIITGKNATNYGSIFASGTNSSNKSFECSVNRTTKNGSATFEISGCIVTKPITITMMQENQTLNQPNIVLGGKLTAEYELQCNDVYLGGVTMKKTFNLTKVGDLPVDTSHNQPTFTLTMTLQTSNHKTLSDTVLIGTDLLLVITGTHGFRMYPQSCVASNSPNSKDHVKRLITNGVADDLMIMTNFTDQFEDTKDNKTDIIEAHLYAFHFLGSNEIYLECTVSVCQDGDNSCPASRTTVEIPTIRTPQSTSTTTSETKTTTTVVSHETTLSVARRKRNVGNTVPHKHTVRTNLIVVDNDVSIEKPPISSSTFRGKIIM
ncbi:hypothetical protein ACJMK2_026698 [Sinanodonta woodiana]|uniref:ZP domain-containing protein n=1 Tax=Sinanodonta woodiana TaxID=1069815 RepID=A0ABD3XP31_SINWO